MWGQEGEVDVPVRDDEVDFPRMRVYDDSLRKHYNWDTSPIGIVPRNYVVVSRFFKAIRGYHEGFLDLTGRHEPRYHALMTRWTPLVADMDRINIHATASPPSNGYGYDDYCFEDNSIWEDFVKRWDVPKFIELGFLVTERKLTDRTMDEHPVPTFQRLCLDGGLPPEMLSMIMSHASVEQARLLSATCKRLREIGLPFIFRTRSLKLLRANGGIWKVQNRRDRRRYIQSIATKQSAIFLDEINFLLSRPDLIQPLEFLSLMNEWFLGPHPLLLGTDLRDGPHYYGPIYPALADLLRKSSNLMSLSWFGVDLTPEMLSAIVALPRLHTLNIGVCVPTGDAHTAMLDSTLTRSNSVLNLSMVTTSSDASYESWETLWDFLKIFPKMRTLHVSNATGNLRLPFPNFELPTNHECIGNLERIFLDNLATHSLPSLSRWISDGPVVSLTHLKLVFGFGMPEDDVLDLLAALQHSSRLDTLALEGLRDARASLISQIAMYCPTVSNLTLIRRHNDRQRTTKLAPWPDPVHEYASRLSEFDRLQHFAWNAMIPGAEYSPITILCFENDFEHNQIQPYELEFLEESEASVARVFATHCSTLRTYAVFADRIPQMALSIERDHHGNIKMISERLNDRWSSIMLLNPSSSTGWPAILPQHNN